MRAAEDNQALTCAAHVHQRKRAVDQGTRDQVRIVETLCERHRPIARREPVGIVAQDTGEARNTQSQAHAVSRLEQIRKLVNRGFGNLVGTLCIAAGEVHYLSEVQGGAQDLRRVTQLTPGSERLFRYAHSEISVSDVQSVTSCPGQQVATLSHIRCDLHRGEEQRDRMIGRVQEFGAIGGAFES